MPGSSGIPIVITREDLLELAVRMGNPNTYSKTGQIVWQDNFSKGLSAFTPGPPTLTDVHWSTAFSIGSGFSSMLDVTVTGAGCSLYRDDPPIILNPSAGICAWESTFLWDSINTQYGMYISSFSNNLETIISLYIRPTTVNLLVNGVLTSLLPVPSLRTFGWHNVKLFANFAKKRYVLLTLDNVEYPISQYALTGYQIAGTDEYIRTTFEALPIAAGGAGRIYVGSAIMTIKEE